MENLNLNKKLSKEPKCCSVVGIFVLLHLLQTQKCVIAIALKTFISFFSSFSSLSQTAETVEAIVTQLMEKQRNARQAALNKQLECGCPETNATNGDKMQCCIHNTTTTAAVSTVRNSQHKVHVMMPSHLQKFLLSFFCI